MLEVSGQTIMTASIYCPRCHKHTALSVAPAEYQSTLGSKLYTQAIWMNEQKQKWWIGICNSCNLPSLVLNNGAQVFPHPGPSPTDPNIPQDLARDLDEAKMCFSVGCYRACVVMTRRCIQSACIAKGATKQNQLVSQIEELANLGVITKDIQKWATTVRWLGNDAAHPNEDEVKEEDAEDCLELAEQFLHVIFVTTALAKARLAQRGRP